MDDKISHKKSFAQRWRQLTFEEQMGNIGSEVSRARLSYGKDENKFWNAVARAQELFFFTLSDKRWRAAQKKEPRRAYEVFL